VLEHLLYLRPTGPGNQFHEADMDLSAWERLCDPESAALRKQSKADLVDELQQCRQKVFSLEKDLAKQAKSLEAETACWKREHERTTGRLMEVNLALEAKLRQQSADCKKFKEQVQCYQRKLEHEQWLQMQKEDRIEELESELARLNRQQEDMLLREREYGQRIMRLHVQEFESSRRNDQRMRRLSSMLQGDMASTLGADSEAERDLEQVMTRTVQSLEREFDEIFNLRQERFKQVAEECEAAINRREERFAEVCDQLRFDVFGPQAKPLSRRMGRRSRRPVLVDAEVQTQQRRVAMDDGDPMSLLAASFDSATGGFSARQRRRSVGSPPLPVKRGGGELPVEHIPTPPARQSMVGSREIARMGALLESPPMHQSSGSRRSSIGSKMPQVAPLENAAWLVRRDKVGKQ